MISSAVTFDAVITWQSRIYQSIAVKTISIVSDTRAVKRADILWGTLIMICFHNLVWHQDLKITGTRSEGFLIMYQSDDFSKFIFTKPGMHTVPTLVQLIYGRNNEGSITRSQER